jgi:hypothetical protein
MLGPAEVRFLRGFPGEKGISSFGCRKIINLYARPALVLRRA